jgi:single-strand DNA-binding protein
MTDSITVTGVVGSDPRMHVTTQGLAITSFRLASTRRYFDRAKGTWEDGETNWYTVSGFRQLAQNTAVSVRKGDRVVVQGRLRLRAWESGEKSGTAIEIEADSIGHDLAWGTTTLTKVRREGATESDRTAVASEVGGWPGVEPSSATPDAHDGADAPGLDEAAAGEADPSGIDDPQLAIAG